MYYVQVLRVPILRPGQAVVYPAADLAARILSCDEAVELRLHRGTKRVECYIGTETPQRRDQLLLLLRVNGYGYQVVNNAPAACQTNLLLHRSIESQYILHPGQNPTQAFLPAQISTDAAREGCLFTALAYAREGSGAVFYFRRHKPLDSATLTALHSVVTTPDSICYKLLQSPALFQAVGCVYAPESQVDLLASELLYNFGGLQSERIPPQNVSKHLLDAPHHLNLPVHSRMLGNTFLLEEIQTLSALSASADRYGLDFNKDTLFSIPLLREPGKVPSVHLGRQQSGDYVYLPLAQMRKHVALFGPIGSGKGNLLFSLATQLYKQDIPILLIESSKQEQHHLGKVMPKLRCWQPKAKEFVFNPFSLPPGVTLGEYRAAMLQQLRVCFKLDGPLEELFSDTLNRCFAAHGYTETSTCESPGVKPFGMNEFMEEYVRLLNEDGYSAKTGQDMKTAGIVRLKTLFNQDRDVFDTVSTVPVTELLKGTNLLQLNCLSTTQSKQLFASMLLVSIGTYLRLRGTHCADKPLKLVILLDESHNLLQPAEDAQGKEFPFARDFANMLLELRSQGVGFVIADQSADNIPSIITKTCATKVFLGGSTDSGILSYADSLRADEEAIDHLYLCGPGEGCFISDAMPHAEFFAAPNIIDCFDLQQPYGRNNHYLKAHPRFPLETYAECSLCPGHGKCCYAQKDSARQRTSELTRRWAAPLADALAEKDEQKRAKQISGVMQQVCLSAWMNDVVDSSCALVQFVREYNRVHPSTLHLETVLKNAQALWNLAKGGN